LPFQGWLCLACPLVVECCPVGLGVAIGRGEGGSDGAELVVSSLDCFQKLKFQIWLRYK